MAKRVLGVAAAFVLALFGREAAVRACGCFAPPDPSVPIVQAGERILFAVKDGQVTAHIQIQYSGAAKDFGWILPLPSVPTLEVGTDELFTFLINTTQPKYRLVRNYDGSCGVATSGSSNAPGAADVSSGGKIVVIQSTVGPYDFAVLHAENKTAMLDWLAANHYFVPAGTDDVVAPYVHQGAYFLALKLSSGADVGDLQPVVVKYASDLPMIPIVLTSVAAQPDMGIQVWMLGAARAIPRNYYHTVIDDALIDWTTAGQNYNDVIIKATREAQGGHTFVTEYAGPSSVMVGQIAPAFRFGDTATLAAQPTPVAFLGYLAQNGYTARTPPSGFFPRPPTYSSVVLEILGRYIPVPTGVEASTFYLDADYYLGAYRQQHPEAFMGYAIDYQPAAIAQELDERVVQPARAAESLFTQFPYLTRLYTTLSPENMNKDPVFSWNKSLPPVSNIHVATLQVHCGPFGAADPRTAPATLSTDSGLRIEYPAGLTAAPPAEVPASARIETLPEEGSAAIVVDNSQLIESRLGGGGCAVAPGGSSLGTLLVASLLVALRSRRRRG